MTMHIAPTGPSGTIRVLKMSVLPLSFAKVLWTMMATGMPLTTMLVHLLLLCLSAWIPSTLGRSCFCILADCQLIIPILQVCTCQDRERQVRGITVSYVLLLLFLYILCYFCCSISAGKQEDVTSDDDDHLDPNVSE